MTGKPLQGITVLELSLAVAVPMATLMLSDQGANVIRVETLDAGDPMREQGSSKGGISALFVNVNRGKRSIRVNLKSDQGQAVIHDLAKSADVLMCNYRPGVMDRLNLERQQPEC